MPTFLLVSPTRLRQACEMVRIEEARAAQKTVLKHLLQFYMYEFSDMEGHDVGSDGAFDTSNFRLDSYWNKPDRFPFLIYVDDAVAGFVLVNSYTCLPENEGARSIAEFFILRKYRRQGVGRAAACQTFDRFPGKWEVRQIRSNIAGQRFWRAVIAEYTRGQFDETYIDNQLWQGPIQTLENNM